VQPAPVAATMPEVLQGSVRCRSCSGLGSVLPALPARGPAPSHAVGAGRAGGLQGREPGEQGSVLPAHGIAPCSAPGARGRGAR